MNIPVGDPSRSFLHHLVDPLPECATWSVSPYWRCDIRCTYCITGAQGRSEPRVARAQVAAQLRRELADVPADALIGVGTISDAYPTIEAELGITREVLIELGREARTVSVVTKSATVVRDIDVLLSSGAQVTMSAATADADAAALLEPNAPTFEERLDAVSELRAAGVPTWISATPWIPGLSDAAALIDQVRSTVGDVPIMIGPLNVRGEPVTGSPIGRRFTQAEVNDAFIAEYHRVGEHPGVRWLRPQPLEGHHVHEAALEPYRDTIGTASG